MPLNSTSQQTQDLLSLLQQTPQDGFRTDPYKLNSLLSPQAAPQDVAYQEEDTDGFLSTLWQIPLGFAEGFTTLSFGNEPRGTNSEIARRVGNLLGFVGYIPSPVNLFRAGAIRFLTRFAGGKVAKRAAEKVVAKAGIKVAEKDLLLEAARIAAKPGYTNAINIKSVPMWMTDKMMGSAAGKGVAASARKLISQTKWLKDSNRFLNEGMVSSIGHGAVHLGLASSVSAAGVNPLEWKERIDDVLPATFGGMVFGAGFAGIGNLGLMLGRSMSSGSPEFAKRTLQAMAGSVFQGLPSTIQQHTTSDQVYEYLLGAWFGFHSQPWTAAASAKKVGEIRKRYETQPEREMETLLRDVKNPEQFERDLGVDLIRKRGGQYEQLADQIVVNYFGTMPGVGVRQAQDLFKQYRIARDQQQGGVYFSTPDGRQFLSTTPGEDPAARRAEHQRLTEQVDADLAAGKVEAAVEIPTEVLSDRGMLYRFRQMQRTVADVYGGLGGKLAKLAEDPSFVDALALKRTLDQYGVAERWTGIKGGFNLSQPAAQELSRYRTSEFERRTTGVNRSELSGIENLQPGETIYHREFGPVQYVETVQQGKKAGQIRVRGGDDRIHRVGKTKTGEVLSRSPWEETVIADTPAFFTALGRRFLTGPGDMAKEAYEANIRSDQAVAKIHNRVLRSSQILSAAVKREWKTEMEKLTPEQELAINSVLTGGEPPENLPRSIAKAANRMRNEVDAMSRELIRSGIAQGELKASIEKNEGSYLHRQYRVFMEPGYAEKFLERRKAGDAEATMIWNRTMNLLRSEERARKEENADYVMRSDNELANYIQTNLLGGKDGPQDFIKGRTMGVNDFTMFIPKKDIAPEIRALWGEYTGPIQTYALSMMKMGNILALNNFQKDVASAGVGKWLFDKPTVAPDPYNGKRNVRYDTPLGPDIKEFGELGGLYTTKEMAAAFKRALDPHQLSPLMREYMKINAAVKMGKTVGSVMTHVRNTTSFVGFSLANGHFLQPKQFQEAVRATMFNLRKSLQDGKPVKIGDREYTPQKFIERLVELEVAESGANTGEYLALIKDSGGKTLEEFLQTGLKRKLRRMLIDAPAAIYKAEDDFIKTYAFLSEFQRYRRAIPKEEMTDAQVEKLAAEIVVKTNPTYSRVNEAVKMARRAPFVGSFVAFPAEIMRTGKNILSQTAKELASDNPAVREIGRQRAFGAISAALLPTAAALTSRLLMGIDSEEDEDFRRYLPPWAENSELLYLGKNDAGSYRYVQFSYSDPYSYVKEPMIALLRGAKNEDVVAGLQDAVVKSLEPFLGEEILSKSILDVVRNRRADSGGPVYNEVADADTRAEQIGEYMLKTIEPGTVSSLRRIASGIKGETNLYGRDYDPAVEAFAAFSGVRLQNMDLAQGLSFKARNFSRDMREASRILSKTAGSRGAITAKDVEDSYLEMERSRRRLFLEFYKDVRAARRMGVGDEELQRILAAASVPKQMQQDLLDGVYRARSVGSTFLQQIEKLARIKGQDEDVKSRRELVKSLEDKYAAQRLGVLPSYIIIE